MIKTALKSFLFVAFVASTAFLAAPASAAQRCEAASQCHGPLPRICMRCSNGVSACAHWACVRHNCEVQLCNGKLTRF